MSLMPQVDPTIGSPDQSNVNDDNTSLRNNKPPSELDELERFAIHPRPGYGRWPILGNRPMKVPDKQRRNCCYYLPIWTNIVQGVTRSLLEKVGGNRAAFSIFRRLPLQEEESQSDNSEASEGAKLLLGSTVQQSFSGLLSFSNHTVLQTSQKMMEPYTCQVAVEGAQSKMCWAERLLSDLVSGPKESTETGLLEDITPHGDTRMVGIVDANTAIGLLLETRYPAIRMLPENLHNPSRQASSSVYSNIDDGSQATPTNILQFLLAATRNISLRILSSSGPTSDYVLLNNIANSIPKDTFLVVETDNISCADCIQEIRNADSPPPNLTLWYGAHFAHWSKFEYQISCEHSSNVRSFFEGLEALGAAPSIKRLVLQATEMEPDVIASAVYNLTKYLPNLESIVMQCPLWFSLVPIDQSLRDKIVSCMLKLHLTYFDRLEIRGLDPFSDLAQVWTARRPGSTLCKRRKRASRGQEIMGSTTSGD